MNKIITINLAGMAIAIDEKAYDNLRSYLRSLEKHFNNTQNGNEILEDIESRIAELFHTKIKAGSTFITELDVSESIEIMGNPSDIGVEDEPDQTFSEQSSYQNTSKKLYRDTNDKILGGVCSGISAYFDLDTSLVRLITIISVIFFGVGALPYLILWVVVPEAKTPHDRMRMKGDAFDIHNIADRVRREAENVAGNLKKNANLRPVVDRFFELVRTIFGAIGKFLGAGVLVIMVIVIVAVTTSFLFTLSGETINLPDGTLTIPKLFESTAINWFFVLSLLFVILIPFATVAYLLTCFIFNVKNYSYNLKAIFAVWLISVAMFVGTGIYGSHQITYDEFQKFHYERAERVRI